MTRYRLYTEDKNGHLIREIADKYLDSYSTFRGIGTWKGQLEPCLVIEHLGHEALYDMQLIAKEVKSINNQEAVLITSESVNFITI